MKLQKYILPFLLGALFMTGTPAKAQMFGDQIFLQGKRLEVGVAPNGSWGNTMPVPAGYHSHSAPTDVFLSYIDPITGVIPAGNGLDFSFDPGNDGWTVGSPTTTNCCHYGPYFLPGTPFDGWAVQMNGVRSDAYFTDEGFNLGVGATFSGTNVGYIQTPGSPCGPYMQSTAAGYWAGNYAVGGGNLSIRSMNRVDTNAGWDFVTVTFRNTGATPITGLYYLVTGDPDNDVATLAPGSYPSNNHICYQNDAQHRVEVNSVPPGGIRPDAFVGLATKDCRAKAIIYVAWPSAVTVQLSDMWAGTTPASASPYYSALYTTTLSQDIAMGLVYNLGNLAPGDSTRISFAWIFTDSTAVDSAFRQPRLNVNCALAPNVDTFNACGMTSVPVNIVNGEWGCTNWTWSPATGLAATTGITNSINPALIGSGITYTITSSDTSSCNTFQFTLYLPPCFSASSNSPDVARICVDDTLRLFAHGDSTGATYNWYGPGLPGTFRGATQNVKIPHIAMVDTGWYYIIKTVGTVVDTERTHVLLKPKPIITATYNPPVCSGNTLILYSNPDSVGETWVWTGPAGFSSTFSDPSRVTAPTSYSGVYTVVATFNGCVDSSSVSVTIDSTPATPVISSNTPVCEGDTLFLYSNSATPGVTYSWSGPSGFTSTLQNPVMLNAPLTASGTYTVTASLGACSSRSTTLVEIRLTPVPVLGTNSPVCSGNPLNLTTTAPPGSTFAWTGPLSFTSTLQYPTINPAITANTGTYSVVVTLNGCSSAVESIFAVVDTTPTITSITTNSPGAPGPSICEGDTLTLAASSGTAGVSYSWTGPNSFASTDQNPSILNITTAASGVYTLVVSVGSCSVAAVISVSITATPSIVATSNSPVCSGSGDTLMLHAIAATGALFTWSGPYVFASNAQDPVRTPVSTEYAGVYHVNVLLDGCTNSASVTVVVNPTPPPPWVKWLTYCQYYDAPYLQAFGSNVLWFSSAAPGGIGSPVPPKPQTDLTGITFYYANQTVMDCPSAIDSIRVTINPTPTVSVSPDVVVCPHDSVLLTAINTDAIAYYHWYPEMYLSDTAGAKVIARPETDMEYTVVTSNMYGCTDTATVSVTVKAAAVIHLQDSVTLYPGENYQIDPVTNCSIYSWTPAGGLSSKYIANPVAAPQISTKYVLTGVTEWGCKTKDSINIYINTEPVFTVPNAFAPGNGANGTFRLIKRGNGTLRHFRIYDRWGVVVFQTSNIEEGWDGTYKGTPQPVGVYVYDITAISTTGNAFNKTGNVTLLR
jgi:gliding motility-associated-like protein